MVKKLIAVLMGLLLLGALFLLLFLAFSLGRCLGPLEIGVGENGQEVNLFGNQTLILTLESNPTTGYSWQLGKFDEAVLKLERHQFVSDVSSGKLGGGGEEIWFFGAQSRGSTSLHLEYTRPWEKDVEPAKTFSVQVKVRPLSSFLWFWEAR